MKYIAIEGNIGAGKTTLAKALASDLNAALVLEQLDDNSYLEKFYQHPKESAFPLEMKMLKDRYLQMKMAVSNLDNSSNDYLIADYFVAKTALFAQMNLDEIDYQLFKDFENILNTNLPNPNLIIYLETPIFQLQKNINKRNRLFEKDITTDYLIKVDRAYKSYFNKNKLPCIHIKTEDFNPLSTEKLSFLKNEIINFFTKF